MILQTGHTTNYAYYVDMLKRLDEKDQTFASNLWIFHKAGTAHDHTLIASL